MTPIDPNGLTADAILNRVRRLRAAPESPQSTDSYRQAAAVLAAIADPARLRPISGPFEPGVGEQLLRGELVAAPSRLGGKVMLTTTARRAALKMLGSPERMLKALDANPGESRGGVVQEQFRNYLAGSAKPLDQQSRVELEATLQVLLWLHDLVPGLPDIAETRRVLALRDFMAPFENLAGDEVFRGRVAELEDLRNFVGVLAPETLRGRVTRAILKPSSTYHALSVFGPGGVGKSALIARFILEHSRLPIEQRVPVAYLDFDRSTLSVSDHRGLAAEMLRQLLLQFPGEAAFEKLQTLLPAADADLADGTVTRFNLENMLTLTMSAVQRQLPDRPYVMILDTFEQVQYLGEAQALPLWQILGKVQERFPFLRIVVAGRAPVATLRLGGELPKQLPIGDLDHEAAVAFVKAADFSDDIAEAIVTAVGGVPLSLKLASRLLSRQPNADLNVGSRFWLRTADEVIQGQLFDRILGQINDLELRRVAHPGLVLRRITPEILLNVLREPCGLAIETVADARELFARLQAEVSLVSTADDGDGALIHRRELREVMLRLLKQRSPAVVTDISERAVEYYRGLTGTRARMEETYHRLLLKQNVDKPLFDDRDVRASIQASMSELPVQSQRLLASYGFTVDAAIIGKATTEEREAAVAEFVEQMLPHGYEGLAQARERLSAAGRHERDSALWRAAARLSFETRHVEGAAEALDRGLQHAIQASNSFRVLELLTDQAWQCEQTPSIASLPESLERLADYAARHDDAAAKIQCFLQTGRVNGKWITANCPVAAIERMFQRLRPRDLFGLFPATKGFWAHACAAGLNGRFFAELLLQRDANFETVTFPEQPETHRALQVMLRYAYGEVSQAESSNNWNELAQAVENVIGIWPYRNIHVHPPVSSSRQFAA